MQHTLTLCKARENESWYIVRSTYHFFFFSLILLLAIIIDFTAKFFTKWFREWNYVFSFLFTHYIQIFFIYWSHFHKAKVIHKSSFLRFVTPSMPCCQSWTSCMRGWSEAVSFVDSGSRLGTMPWPWRGHQTKPLLMSPSSGSLGSTCSEIEQREVSP